MGVVHFGNSNSVALTCLIVELADIGGGVCLTPLPTNRLAVSLHVVAYRRSRSLCLIFDQSKRNNKILQYVVVHWGAPVTIHCEDMLAGMPLTETQMHMHTFINMYIVRVYTHTHTHDAAYTDTYNDM